MKIKQCEVLKIVGHKITYSEYFIYGKNIGLEKENTPKLTIPSCERVTDAFFFNCVSLFFLCYSNFL